MAAAEKPGAIPAQDLADPQEEGPVESWRVGASSRCKRPWGIASSWRDRWRWIIRFKHPALAGHETDVRACLQTPSMVRESTKEPDVHLYYAPTEGVHLCVVTAAADNEERFIVTAYFTKNIKPGKELWRS